MKLFEEFKLFENLWIDNSLNEWVIHKDSLQQNTSNNSCSYNINGAKLIENTRHWEVYLVETKEAAEKLSKGTRGWWFTEMWDKTVTNVKHKPDFCAECYILISKDEHLYADDYKDKLLLIYYEEYDGYLVLDSYGNNMQYSSIPYLSELSINGLADYLSKKRLNAVFTFCSDCAGPIFEDDYDYVDDPYNLEYCKWCYKEKSK